MGQCQAKKRGIRSKRKEYKRKIWLCRREKDTDQIQDMVEKDSNPVIPYNDELPGGGQFYCAETDCHFTDAKPLADHKKTKMYKKRVKQLKEEKYTQHKSDWGAGMTQEVLPPAHEKI
mmetsp:Transcript_8167/g.10667  ORF Transcript_8167/g.10667 Transcript_8167/m.10667 type:complete len:118 (+) Transcript_8167:133-486(+)|eukprot:CAMPEP_0198150094 /NCGR_PEP_ID=MMETSP1443-20131203/49366_1 /TAXON_ID=186043 /ORGANISM="Entomoneis sp., Strain CCMP2396" /LENGTH=117 /DNA_ID=CAMNT_0043815301 /DNA_START=117 /DNA_END=470 /DNA_ORIENTATION=+